MLYSLYVKTHLTTGLKYLGYTKQDPFVYKGSGTRWLNHLKIHGNDVWTNIIIRSEDIKMIEQTGKELSKFWNITESNEWANLKPEEGQGGSIEHTPEAIKKIKKARAKQITTKETKQKYSDRCSNSRWFNDGSKERFSKERPPGWNYGRLYSPAGKKLKVTSKLKNTLYYNDGVNNYRVCPDKADPSWVIGMAPRKSKLSSIDPI